MQKRNLEKPKVYVLRKYIKAKNLKEALLLEPKTDVHDAWIDTDWQRTNLPNAIGFDDGLTSDEE